MKKNLGIDIGNVQAALRREGDIDALTSFRSILDVLREHNSGVGEFLLSLDRDIQAETRKKGQPISQQQPVTRLYNHGDSC
jgi:hypothetical protein